MKWLSFGTFLSPERKVRSVFLLLLLLVLLPSCSLKDAAQRMSLELRQVKVKDFSNEGFTATVYMQVNNPNGFSVKVADLRYQAYVRDVEVANGHIQKEIEIPSEGSVIAELPIVVSLGSLGDCIPDVLRGKIDYRVTGEAVLKTWFGKYTLPFDTRKHKKEKKDKKEAV